MRILPVLLIAAFGFGFHQNQDLTYKHPANSVTQFDTANKIDVDDYPVTNEMLAGNSGQRSSGPVVSMDKVWFSNHTLNQTLVFELYTDYHRFFTYHFANDNIPSDLISRMELYVKVGRNSSDTASDKLKQRYFRDFLKSSKYIGQKYLRSCKGFELGDLKEKAIQIYGMPDIDTNLNEEAKLNKVVERCQWNFIGDIEIADVLSGKLEPTPNKPFVNDSFGYHVTMYFRSNKLIGMILNNDIP